MISAERASDSPADVDRWPRSHIAHIIITMPARIRRRASTSGRDPVRRRPQASAISAVITPPGIIASPVCVGEKPRMLCVNSGKMITPP